MVFDVLQIGPMFQGLLLAVLGVGFWIGGLLVANYYWNRIRGDGNGE